MVLTSVASADKPGGIPHFESKCEVERHLNAMRQRSKEVAVMCEWFDRAWRHVDIAELQRSYPDVGWHAFRDRAREQDRSPSSS